MNRRQAYEAAQRRRSLIVAGISTAVALVAIVLLVPLSPGWPQVRASFFDVDVFAKTFPTLLSAFLVDIMIFAWSVPLILALGLAIALARGARTPLLFPLRIFGAVYVDIFRGVPVVLTIYLIGFGVPGLGLPRPWNSPYIWGTVALVLTYSAYIAEVIRGGLAALPKGQYEAGDSLGLDYAQNMRLIILPQALKISIPGIVNIAVGLFKDTTLVSVISMFDLVGMIRGPILSSTEWNGVYWELWIFAVIMFFIVCYSISQYSQWLERQLATGHR